MSRRSLSKKNYAQLNKGRPIRCYPPGGNRAQVRVSGPKQRPKGSR